MGLGRLVFSTAVICMTAMALSTPALAKAKRRDPNPNQKERRAFERALDAFDHEQYAKSRRLLLGLLKDHRQNALYWFNLGNVAIKLQLWKPAMSAYEQVVKLKSPLAGVAGIYLSKAARADGKLEVALHWMQWVKKRSFPPNIQQLARDEAGFVQAELVNQGLAAYETEDYPRAIAAFDKVQTLEGDPQLAGQAEMMKGLSLLRQDKTEQARAEFEALMNSGAQGVQQYARYFSRLDQQTLTLDPPYWLALDLALTYNNNLFADGDPGAAEGRAVIPWFIGGGIRVFRSGFYTINLGDNLSGEEVLGLSSSRYFKNSSFGLLKFQSQGWQIQFRAQVDYSALGGQSYSLRPQLSASGQRIISGERFGLTLTAAYQNPGSDQFSYIQGSAYSARAFWIHRYASGVGGPFIFINRENGGSIPLTTGTIPVGYSGFGPGFSGYLNPIQGWEVSGSASCAFRNFSDLAEPGDLTRTDRALNFYARAAHRLSPHFAPYLSLDATVNSSSLGSTAPENKNYGQFIVATGVSWDLL